jgi:hypothetical protein
VAGNGEQNRPRKSVMGWSVVIGSATLAAAGALTPQPSDFNVVTGAIYGFVLGAIIGVLADRRIRRIGK